MEGLPHCPTEQIIDILKDKYDQLAAVFAQYCKQGSECTTIASSTRLKIAGFRKLVKDANLELKVFDFDAMARLFAQCSPKGGGGVGGGKAIPSRDCRPGGELPDAPDRSGVLPRQSALPVGKGVGRQKGGDCARHSVRPGDQRSCTVAMLTHCHSPPSLAPRRTAAPDSIGMRFTHASHGPCLTG